MAAATFFYGGDGAPFLIHGLIAAAALAAFFIWPKEEQPTWPFANPASRLILVLLIGFALQAYGSPNRWEWIQSILWAVDALLLVALFRTPSSRKPSAKVVVAALLAVCLLEVLLLPFAPLIDFTRAGTFVNANHTAALLTFGFWLAFRTSRPLFFGDHEQSANWRTLLTSVLACGVILCFSMGATLALALASVLFLLRNHIKPKITVPVVFLILLGVQIHFAYVEEETAGKILAAVAPTKVNDDTRRGMTRAAVALWKERPLLGHGLGSYAERFPSVADIETTDRVANYAHHDVLQLLAELGTPLFLIAAWLVTMLFLSLLKHHKEGSFENHRLRQAVFWSGVTLGFHSLVDFPWHVPLVALAILALCAESIASPRAGGIRSRGLISSFAILQLAAVVLFSIGGALMRFGGSPTIASLLRPGDPVPAMREAQRLLQKGDAAEGVRWIRKAAARAPYNSDVLEILGTVLSANREYQDAAIPMEKAGLYDRRNGKRLERTVTWLLEHGFSEPGFRLASEFRHLPHYWRSVCLRTMAGFADDPLLLRRCIDARSPDMRRELALFLQERGQIQAAFEEAFQSIAPPIPVDWIHWYSELTIRASQHERALNQLKPFFDGANPDPSSFHLAGKILLAAHLPDRAVPFLDRAANLAGVPATVWPDMRRALELGTESETCQTLAEKWLKEWPHSPSPHLAQAICFHRTGKLNHALFEVQQALQMDVGNQDAWSLKIDVWSRRGMPDRAVDTACESLSALHGNAQYLQICIRGLAQSGRCSSLRTAWETNKSRWPDKTRWNTLAGELMDSSNGAVRKCLGNP
ncbi:MAG TPA: O-antigen ligase family protein [Bdellovibrionota bacterium]|nr:O-antigen ligase family protein [Bdellovibrionota bacterium]